MNGAVEEVGQTARGVVAGLSAQPLILAMVLLQFITIGGVVWLSYHRQSHFEGQFRYILEKCFPPTKQAEQ